MWVHWNGILHHLTAVQLVILEKGVNCEVVWNWFAVDALGHLCIDVETSGTHLEIIFDIKRTMDQIGQGGN